MRLTNNITGNNSSGTNPNAIFEGDRSDNQIECGFIVTMIATQEQHILRQTTVIANANFVEVVDPYFFANPGIITNGKQPWIFNINGGFYDYTLTDFRAKSSKNPTFETRKWEIRRAEKESIDKIPKRSFQATTTRLIPAVIVN